MKVAICGGIGSGKSVVLRILKNLGAKVISADEVNSALLKDENYIFRLKEAFPEAFSGRVFLKSEFSRIIFSDEEKRKLLNSIAHPIIMDIIISSDAEFAEVPLLTKDYASYFDHIWYVEAEDELRRKRIVERDGRSDDEISDIFNSQIEYTGIIDVADIIIHNNGDIKSLEKYVGDIYWNLKKS